MLREPVVVSLDTLTNVVCKVAAELETRANISDQTFDQLYARFGRPAATELFLILSFYCAVAKFINATRTPIGDDNPLQRSLNRNLTS